MKKLKLLYPLIIIFVLSGCLGQTGGDECPFGAIPEEQIIVILLEEESQQTLIGDAIGGSIYNYDEVIVKLNDNVKQDPIYSHSSILVNDWPNEFTLNSLQKLEYIIELPHNQIPNQIDIDTLLIEYMVTIPDNCSVRYGGEHQLSFIRATYNGTVYYEGNPISDIPVRLDRI